MPDRFATARSAGRRLAAARAAAARFAALLLALAGLACAEPPAAPLAPGPPRPPLRVGTSGDYPPFSLALAAEDAARAGVPYRGFDVELAERFAADAGFDVRWVPFRWPELEARLAAGDFDVAMSGITWRPWRSVVGTMTRAVAVGGPCVVGAAGLLDGARSRIGLRVAVNRGGVLERWAREHLRGAQLLAIERNLDLARLLQGGRVDAVVTDSFEAAHLGVAGAPRECAPARDRKVAWVAPARADDLGPRLDAWLAANEEAIDAMRVRWFGASARRSETDHLLDLLARRLAHMPAVAAWKRARGAPVEDPAREARVIEAARAAARAAGLAPEPVAALFRLQIALGKRIQREAPAPADAPPVNLAAQIRPELVRLGDRIVASAARVAPLAPEALAAADWAPLDAWLDAAERAALRDALLALRPAPAPD